ncbi:MAG: orotate phosphoribosyltransferase [bacterium]
MQQAEILKLFSETGALLNGHFLLTSGLHSEQYFQCARVMQYPHRAENLCSEIASHFAESEISAVIAPAIGGIVVAHEVGRALGVRVLFAERENGQMALRRGFEIFPQERVLVVEDVVTTGGSVKEVLQLVKKHRGLPVGVGCLVDRSSGQVDFEVEMFSLIALNIKTMPPSQCELCKKGRALVKPGSRQSLKND